MTLFKLDTGDSMYGYPDSLRDIKASAFLHYVQHILSTHPQELEELYKAQADVQRLTPDIQKYEKKHDLNASEIMDRIADMPRKTMLYFPEVFNEWMIAKHKLHQLERIMGNKWYATKYLPFMAKVVSHFTGVPLEACNGIGKEYMLVGTLEFLFEKIMAVVRSDAKDEAKQEYLINGTKYLLPDALMKKSTLIEFAEAAQFEEATASVKNGEYMAMLDVAAVLLRPEGVGYSEEQYEANRAVFEEHMNMYDLYQVGFFLARQSEKYGNALQNYTLVTATRAIND